MQSNQNPLVELLEAIADEVEQMAEALDDVMWNAFVETEQRTVGQLLDHIAWAWIAESAAFRAIARGASGSGITQEWLDAENAKQARLSEERSRAEILERLRKARTLAVGFVSSLTPEQLERRGTHMPGEPERSVAEWVEVCLIGHPREHMPEIEEAVRATGTK
jgi:DinB family protein